MNSIEIHHLQTSYGYSQNMWFIDGRVLPEYLDVWAADFRDKSLDSIPENFFNLCPAWSMELDYAGDVRFVWKVVQMESAVVPLLLCEEDLDFSCIVIVVEVKKTKDSVYWNRIGYVTHKNKDFEEEKKSGILKLEAYTDEDWERYGDNIALEAVGSPEKSLNLFMIKLEGKNIELIIQIMDVQTILTLICINIFLAQLMIQSKKWGKI